MEEIVEKTKKFLEKIFRENEHFSFGYWKIMYDHSIIVLKYALQIAETEECDKLVLRLGALLHDSGKAYKADEETLMKMHEKFSYEISKDFLNEFDLNEEQKTKLRGILTSESDTVEKHIIEDADIISFYADEQLQEAFNKWAIKKGMPNEMKRKLGKIKKLRFKASKKIAKPFYQKMKERWDL